jgi:hypothetical protein
LADALERSHVAVRITRALLPDGDVTRSGARRWRSFAVLRMRPRARFSDALICPLQCA